VREHIPCRNTNISASGAHHRCSLEAGHDGPCKCKYDCRYMWWGRP
jgi:hypothetical protein